jgi:hypothetical protein
MNRLSIVIILLVFWCVSFPAQTVYEWSKGAGGRYTDSGKCIATDSQGNTFVAGTFAGTITLGTTTLTCNSTTFTDIFIAKMDSNGSLLWAVKAGGSYLDTVNSMATDRQGDCIITGTFQTSANFGSTTLISSGGALDVFVAKLSATGTWMWSQKTTGSAVISGFGLATDINSNIYVCGNFKGNSNFGPYTIISNTSSYDLFVAKMSAGGEWLWAKQTGGSGDDTAFGIASDDSGNCYVTGNFRNSVNFGSTLLNASGFDIFIGKMDSYGNWLWAKKAGGSSNDYGYSIAIDQQGSCFVTGYYKGTAQFGSVTLPADAGTNNEVFVAKLSSTGVWSWAKRAGGSLSDTGNGIVVDNIGNCYVIGSFAGTATFETNSIQSNGGSDIFIAYWDTNGKLLTLSKIGGSGEDVGNGIAIDLQNNYHLTGSFSGTITLGSIQLESNGSSDAFVAKINPSTIIVPTMIYANTPTAVQNFIVNSTQALTVVPAINNSNAIVTSLTNFSRFTNFRTMGFNGSGLIDVSFTLPTGLWFGAVYYQGTWHCSVPEYAYNSGLLTFPGVDFGASQNVTFVLSEGVHPLSPGTIVVYQDIPTEVRNVVITSSKTIVTNPSIDFTNEIVSRLPNYSSLVDPLVLGFSGSGVSDIQIEMGPGLWYGTIYYNHNWFLPDPPYLLGFGGVFTFPQVDFSAKGTIIIVLSDGVDMGQTLPVELSSFTAISHFAEFNTIAWVTESELDVLGFNVLRSEIADLKSAIKLNISLLQAGSIIGAQSRYTFKDNQIDNNTRYYYWLESVEMNGVSHFTNPVSILVEQATVEPGVPQIPITTKLLKAYPNPFNPQTCISYSLAEAGSVTLEIFNTKGQLIRTFAKTHNSGGYFEISWDGTDKSGQPVSSGVYLYRMSSGKYSASSKVMLVK